MCMNEVLTRTEMETQFDGEWVVAGDPEINKSLDVLSGYIVAHGKDRDAVYARAAELQPKHSAYLYFGEMPKHVWLSGWRYFGSGD